MAGGEPNFRALGSPAEERFLEFYLLRDDQPAETPQSYFPAWRPTDGPTGRHWDAAVSDAVWMGRLRCRAITQ